jgi:hypothetical protein
MAVPKHRKTSTQKKKKYQINKFFVNRNIKFNEFDIFSQLNKNEFDIPYYLLNNVSKTIRNQ